MVVMAIIAVLAALLVPLIQHVQAKAMASKCKSKARAIGNCVFTYSARWSGYTSADASFYVKELYELPRSTDPGYDSGTAAAVQEFKCPLDAVPCLNGHGYPSSYALTRAYVGYSLAYVKTMPAETVLLVEIGKTDRGKRHPGDGRDDLQKHYLFADGRIELGWNRPPLLGLRGRWWNEISAGNWGKVRSDTYEAPPDYELEWVGSLRETRFIFLPQTGKPGNWGVGRGNAVDGILLRMDGHLKFPRPGNWHILALFDQRVLVWIDANRDGEMAGNEVGQSTQVGAYVNLLTVPSVDPNLLYECVFMYHESTRANYMNFYWSQDDNVLTDPEHAPKELIPGTALRHIP